MIEIRYIGPLACPFLLCATCGLAITDSSTALARWPEGATRGVDFIHKGRCDDGRDCNTDELDAFLSYLVANTTAGGQAGRVAKGEIALP